jgi:hypothetical protein
MKSVRQPADPESGPAIGTIKSRFLEVLGPGLITGASDDDPSGIATYSQAGAQYGYAMAWTLVVTYPLMAGVQEISARIGRTTGRGLAGNIIQVFPASAVYPLVLLLLTANIINIGADLGAMGEVVGLLAGGGPRRPLRDDMRGDAALPQIHALCCRPQMAHPCSLRLCSDPFCRPHRLAGTGARPRAQSLFGDGPSADGRCHFRDDDQSLPLLLAGVAGSGRRAARPRRQPLVEQPI